MHIKKTLLMSISSAIRLFSTLIIFIILARVLGPKDFGVITYNYALASLLILMVDYGFSVHLLKVISKDNSQCHRFVSTAVYSKLSLTLASFILILFINCLPFELLKNQTLFWELYASLVFFSFSEIFNIAYRGLGVFGKETHNISFGAIINLTAILTALIFTKDLFWIGFSFFASRGVYLIYSLKKFLDFLNKKNFAIFKVGDMVRFTKDGAIYAVDGFVTNFFYQVDSIFVKHLIGVVALGQYQAAMKFLQGIIQFASVLANVYIPEITKSLNDGALLKSQTSKLNDSMFYFGLLSGLGLALGGKSLGDLIYGNAYSIDQKIWTSMGLLVFLRYLSGSIGTVLIALGNQRQRVVAQVLSTILLLIISPMLIKHYDITGMLLALQAAVFLTFVLYMYIAHKNHVATGFNLYKLLITIVITFLGVSLEF